MVSPAPPSNNTLSGTTTAAYCGVRKRPETFCLTAAGCWPTGRSTSVERLQLENSYRAGRVSRNEDPRRSRHKGESNPLYSWRVPVFGEFVGVTARLAQTPTS